MTDPEKGAKIISLEEFRDRVRNPTPEESLYDILPPEYNPSIEYKSDYRSQFAVKNMLEHLNGDETSDSIVVLSRFVMKRSAQVVETRSEDSRYYAVDKNYGELEELAADLENIPEVQARRIGLPLLERLYIASLVAEHDITSLDRLDDTATNDLPLPEIVAGSPLNIKDSERLKEIRTWQSASGLGLLAVTQGQPTLRLRLKDYLGGVLEHRFFYAQALRDFESSLGTQIFGLVPPDGDEISDRLVGICKPLPQHELDKALNIKR